MYFLPHYGVIRFNQETTKVRVVFDGSAKSDKSTASFNKCLQKGPNLVPHLFDIVVKFRGYPIAVVADIEKAFHQIQMIPEERRMLRFLWFDGIERLSANQAIPVLKACVWLKVAEHSFSSAYA